MYLNRFGRGTKRGLFSPPCVTLRAETEWVETVTAGWNQLADVSPERIAECLRRQPARHEIGEYGDGHAAEKILRLL